MKTDFLPKEKNIKTSEKIHNQSTELLQTEEIFINQKEEIKKIKKKRLELKNSNQNSAKGINLNIIKNRKEKKFNTIDNINLTETKKFPRNNFKLNSKINKNIVGKTKIISRTRLNNNNNIKKLKLKFPSDNTSATKGKNENKSKKIRNLNNNTQEINKSDFVEENTIINNDNDAESIIDLENEIDFLSLLNINKFQRCDCIISEKINENYYNELFDNENNNTNDEIPKIKENWTNINIMNRTNTYKKIKLQIPNIIFNSNFNFNNTVIRTKNVIDYNTKGVKINLHLKLYDKSSFWIFTRCYIDNNIEDNKKFKTINANSIKMNLDINDNEDKKSKIFNKYSTVIKIFKNKNSNQAFVSFGTFYKNKKSGHLHYKTFLKRQLVDFVHEDNNYYYLENDLCEFDIIVIDLGNEFLQAKISLNNREKYNNIKSNFYLPITQKAKLMFCGEGNNIKITELEIKSFIKYDENRERFDLILSDERKACDRCLIG